MDAEAPAKVSEARRLREVIRPARAAGLARARGGHAQHGQVRAVARGLALLDAGDAQAACVRFRAVLGTQPHHVGALINLAAACARLGRLGEACTHLWHAIALDRRSEPAWANLARICLRAGAADFALEALTEALEVFPDDADLLGCMGDTLHRLRRFPQALDYVERAVALDPANERHRQCFANCLLGAQRFREAQAEFARLSPAIRVSSLVNEGLAILHAGDAQAALEYFDRSIAARRDVVAAWVNKAIAYQQMEQLGAAFEALTRAIELGPRNPVGYFNMSLLLLRVGRYEEGLEFYEWRLRLEKHAGVQPLTQAPRWDGRRDLAGKVLLVRFEQGAGDAVQVARYFPLLVQRGIMLCVQAPASLAALLASVDPAVRWLGLDELPGHFDAWVEMMSLPYVLGTRCATIPWPSGASHYLSAVPALQAAWRARLEGSPGALQVGIAWRGNPDHENDFNRSIHEPALLAPLLAVPGVGWHCLQPEVNEAERAVLSVAPVRFWQDELQDYAQTAALIDNLDLVIAVDTSVVHVAGALGRPVWVMLAYSSDWRWLAKRADSPWYPSARLFRQPAHADWPGLLAALCGALRAQVEARLAAVEPACASQALK